MHIPSPHTPLAGVSNARLPAWALPAGWPTEHNGTPLTADLTFADGQIATIAPSGQANHGLWDLGGALTLPGLVEPHAHLDKTYTIERCRPSEPGLLAAIRAMHEDRRHWTAQDLQRRASAALARAAANGVTHLRTHIDWFTAAAPDAWQEIARLDHPGISVERVALVPLGVFADPAAAEAIAQTVAEGGEGCLLGGFVHSSNWDPAAMENLLRSATRWRLDLDLHIDEELSDNPRGLAWLAEYLSRHAFPGRLCCSHGCALACGSEEQAEKILRQLAAHSVTLIALPMTNLLLQDAVTGRTPRQRGITLLQEARCAGVATLLGCDNVQDAFCPAGSYDPLDTLACGLFSAQLSDVFDRQSQLICDRAALTGAPADAAPFAVGNAASVVIFPGSDRFTWPLNSAARLVINRGRLTHQRVWRQEMTYES
ncbi:amidohydrolase family protein [Raoultella ornithinolytica]|uniref:amidohydrolase family protein n=1 Tax=Raoultella ornithinolytica TaxID=54291 RepID=UPI000CF31348|nr:amidohydrolase family protein [Raoultella ornithinolytica]PQH32016.1 cytosine deaminase [Raoultella ornithinolytica]QQO49265.1 amidohydrolase family protein [Raoultella ornithinolytica]VEC79969.1 Cytosine deaminase [Raoultella ornithinolytica]HEC2578254.1 amidohydrolase family protein [Raoultella ornithinolytica]HEC2585315.1 amidohydrolase family protein [Raoultella ornithinolytica]